MIDSAQARDVAIEAARVADDEHGTDIKVLQVGVVTIIADYFVLVTASNKRLARRLTEEIEARIGESLGEKPLRREGVGEFDWVVIDYGDVMVHIFSTETREFYEIERLYGDVPTIDWHRDGTRDDRAGGTTEAGDTANGSSAEQSSDPEAL